MMSISNGYLNIEIQLKSSQSIEMQANQLSLIDCLLMTELYGLSISKLPHLIRTRLLVEFIERQKLSHQSQMNKIPRSFK